MLLNIAAQSLIGFGLMALSLFLPAGTWGWAQGWVFLGLTAAGSLAITLWLRRTDPGLLAERMKSPFTADQKPRDRVVVVALFVCFAAWFVAMGIDARRGWSRTPLWAQAFGAALIVVVFWGYLLVLRANSFAAVTVRVQKERGQTVASTGPYAVVRHPMYACAPIFFIGTPLLLGSLWGLLGLVVFVPLLAARALGEEAVLLEGLPGYRDYAAKVRFRLLPGVW